MASLSHNKNAGWVVVVVVVVVFVLVEHYVVVVVVIFRSARTSCTTFGWSRPSVPCALKMWITYIQACMPY